jgi:hypothetical protein
VRIAVCAVDFVAAGVAVDGCSEERAVDWELEGAGFDFDFGLSPFLNFIFSD